MTTTDGVVITCMDPRIDPLDILGIDLPRAAVVRTAGGRVTAEVVDGVAAARGLFDIEWIIVMHHNDCGVHRSRVALESLAADAIGRPISLEHLRVIEDQGEALIEDIEMLAHPPGVAVGLSVAGYNWDPDSGSLALCERRGPSHPMLAGSRDEA